MSEPPTHDCIHNALHHRHEGPTLRTSQYYSTALLEKRLVVEVERGGESVDALDQAPPSASWRPLRIQIIDDALYSDEGHTCFEQGQNFWSEGQRQTCAWDDVLTPQKRDTLVKRLMPQAVDFFSHLLRVRPVQGALRLNSFFCGFDGGVQVPRRLRAQGVAEADMVIFLTARPIRSDSRTTETIAFAGHCERDQYGRPIGAHFNWSPRQLVEPSNSWLEHYLARVAMHELTHALVFSPELVQAFPHQPTMRILPTPQGSYASAISSPRVLRAVRKHFGCEELEGAQLEDGGGAGTASSHWEMRWLRDEYMTGSASPGVLPCGVCTADG